MKTYETEKNNIPEGATHYRNEDENSLFTWLKVGDDIELWCDILEVWRGIGSHVNCIMDKLTPIPQTKGVEWDGEYQLEHGSGWFKYKATYTASNGSMFAMCLVPNANSAQPFEQHLDVATTKFRAIETPEDQKKREELEMVKDAMSIIYAEVGDRSDVEGVVLRMIAAGYRRGGE